MRHVLTLTAFATVMTAAVACAEGTDPAGAGTTSQTSASAGACGSVPTIAPKDSTGVLASLGPTVPANYNGFTQPVEASPWKDWKPSHAAPYRVAISVPPAHNTFQSDMLAGIKRTLAASGQVTITKVLSPSTPADVPGQLQQVNQLIADKPDLLIMQPIAPGPSAEVMNAAAKAGIPVVSAWNSTPTASAVSVGLNNFLQAATTAAKVVTAMGGKGSILLVHGIPGIQQDTDAMAGFKAVLALCPNVKVAGEVTGGYVDATAKTAVLQFLTTHPAGVDGVLQSGVMGLGVINAFQQLGKKVPPLADLGSSRGTIAYAHENASSFQEFGTGTPNEAIGDVIAKVSLRILAGDGPKVNQILTQPSYLTNDNLGEVYQSGWNTTTTGNAANPTDKFMADDYIATFFTKSSR